tara:strand:- start:2004 stop:3194 length:1191 start_codon:yes stop_codon:yes gene_type:complete
MSEEKLDVASEFANLTGTEIEVSHESAPNANSEDSQLESNIIDLTENKEETQEQETPVEMTQDEESPQEIIESSLKSDSRKEENEQETEEQSSEAQDSSNDSYDKTLSMLNETYGTEYEDLNELLDNLEGKSDGQNFASEQMAELNRFVSETGRSPQDYFKTQTQNYDEMSEADVIKEYLSLENPELSQKEIDLFFDSTYKLNEDKYSPEETELGKIHLKRDVSKARGELKELQEEYWSPEKSGDTYSDEELQNMEAEVDKARETFYNDMDEELDSIESLTFKINDNESFDYKLTDEDKQVVGEAMSNLDDFFEPYMDEQGNLDKESLALDMMAMKLQDKIVRSVASQYRSKGSEQVLQDIKNPSFEPAKVTDNKGGGNIDKQISDQIFGDSTLWG